MSSAFRIRFIRSFLPVLALAAVAACGDTTGPEEHPEARGVVIVDVATGQPLVSVDAQRQVTGSITVQAGAQRPLAIFLLDEAGVRFRPEDEDERIEVAVAQPAIATIAAQGESHVVTGVAAGTTTVLVSLMHGGHADYVSPAIPLVVTQ